MTTDSRSHRPEAVSLRESDIMFLILGIPNYINVPTQSAKVW